MKRFIDSNIFIYAYSADVKAEIAQTEITAGGYISVQVMSEVANAMRRKMRREWTEIEERMQDIELAMLEVLPLTRSIQRQGFEIAKKHDVSIYDSLIIASALSANCDELITEDLQHGQRFGKLVIRNPFLA